MMAEWYALALYVEQCVPFGGGGAVRRKLHLERLLEKAWDDFEKHWPNG